MEEKQKRIKMKPVSEAARGWAEALAREVGSWPGATLKSAFGMTMIYRNGVVFAALPRTRTLYEEDAILLKFNRETPALRARMAAEPRLAPGSMEQRGVKPRKPGGESRHWRIFLMRSQSDFHPALEWLAEAHRLASVPSRQH